MTQSIYRNQVAAMLRAAGINPQRLYRRAWYFAAMACRAGFLNSRRIGEVVERVISHNHQDFACF